MESITKNRQSAETLQSMIARAYGADQVPVGEGWVGELGHGWFNVAYRLRLRDGSGVVVKIAPPPDVEVMTYERGAMRTEVAALELIKRETSVPVPEVDFADTRHDLVNADYFFMPYVDADNLGIIADTLSADARTAYEEQVGAATRQLNEIRGPAFGPLTGAGHATWREAFLQMCADVLSDGARRVVDLGWEYDAVREVLEGNADSLDEVDEPRYVEWDLWNSNVMVRGGDVVSIIDHERCFFGDPLMEAGFVAAELPAFGDPTGFLRGYGRAALTPTEHVRRRLYNLHLSLIMAIETVYRGHTEPTQYDWARERLDEVMASLGRTR